MKKIALLLALALLAAPFMANAGQLSSDFRGRVVDAQGQAVPGAVMMVEAIETGRVTRHVANAKGRWHAVGLRSDLTYRVSCYAPGAAVPAAVAVGLGGVAVTDNPRMRPFVRPMRRAAAARTPMIT